MTSEWNGQIRKRKSNCESKSNQIIPLNAGQSESKQASFLVFISFHSKIVWKNSVWTNGEGGGGGLIEPGQSDLGKGGNNN